MAFWCFAVDEHLVGCPPLVTPRALRIDERCVGASLGAQFLHVNLADNHLRLEREPLCLLQQMAVLIDKGVAAEDHVLRTLAEPASAIDIS